MELTIQLLGGFEVCVGDRQVERSAWQRRKAMNLVKILAMSPHLSLHREEILELLWPERSPVAAGNNLRVVLHAARRALASTGYPVNAFLQIRDEQVVLDVDGLPHIDVHEFERAASAAFKSKDLSVIKHAVDLYTGALLPEDRYEEWAISHRERLSDSHARLLIRFAEELDDAGFASESRDVYECVLVAEPTNEQVAARLMAAYMESGQRDRSLRLFSRVREALNQELDAQPDEATTKLYGEILSGQFGESSKDEPSLPEAAPRSTNLPVPLSTLVGRVTELRQIVELLEKFRLLTLSGPGGCGKTRLAIATGQRIVQKYPDGVWFADLSPVVSDDGVTQVVASSLNVKLEPTIEETQAIATAIRTRRLLLILDNCEHVVAACAQLAERLLQHCPELQLLVTSREPLHIDGEQILRVPTLQLPATDATAVADALECEATQLFTERARSVRPEFTLTTENVHTVIDLCRRLNGLPLAIELAAARVSMFSVEELAIRLAESFQILSGGSRTVLPRHQSLSATLQWSFDLLDPDEQRLFVRLAVFAGGWNLEAAEAICADDGAFSEDVLILLAQLVDKSLVDVQMTETSVRYRLLDTVRHFVRDQLRQQLDAEELRRRHAEYYLNLSETAEPELTKSRQAEWLNVLEQDHDNIRAALTWAIENERLDIEARMSAALWRFWGYRGYLAEGLRRISGALSRSHSSKVPRLVRARLFQGAGALTWNLGELNRAEESCLQALALFEEEAEPHGIATTTHILGLIAEWRGEYDLAMQFYSRSRAVREELGDKAGVGTALQSLGNVARESGQLEQAKDFYTQSLALQREVNYPRGIALALANLGVVALDEADYQLAEELAGEALAILKELDDKSLTANAFDICGYAALHQNELQRALVFHTQCLVVAREAGDKRGTIFGLEGVASVAAWKVKEQELAVRAVRLYGAAESVRLDIDLPLSSADRKLNEPSISAARKLLGDTTFAEEWASGTQWSLEVAISETLVTGDLLAELHDRQLSSSSPGLLSPREQEVAVLLTRDLTNRQIADELGTSKRTIDTHVSNTIRKLGLSSRRDIATWAIENCLNET